jgi:hypothetical protein
VHSSLCHTCRAAQFLLCPVAINAVISVISKSYGQASTIVFFGKLGFGIKTGLDLNCFRATEQIAVPVDFSFPQPNICRVITG